MEQPIVTNGSVRGQQRYPLEQPIVTNGSVRGQQRYPLEQPLVSNGSVRGQQKSWSKWADGQANLGLCYPHIPEDTFLHVTAHLINY